MTRVPSLLDFLAEQLADTQTAWSVGTFGAVAEFTRNAAEAATLDLGPDAISAVTARGGLRIEAHRELRPIASESLTTQSWSQRVALCLHEGACTMNGRTVLTEIGPDRDALRAEDRAAILFDLGLGALQLDACVRAGGATVVAALRRWVGHSLFGPDHTAMGAILAANPHRVFLSRVGRAEVFQPIPPPGRRSAHTCSSQAAAVRTHPRNHRGFAGWMDSVRAFLPAPSGPGQLWPAPAFPAGSPRVFSRTSRPVRRSAAPEYQTARRRIHRGRSRALRTFDDGRQVRPSRFARRVAPTQNVGEAISRNRCLAFSSRPL
jgi:hypothetical protein